MEEKELEELIDQAREDPDAFGRIYDVYQPRAYGYISRRIADMHDAEDVTAQVFEKVLRAIKRFDPNLASFDTWFYRIIDNTIIDYYRTRRDYMETSFDKVEARYVFKGAENTDFTRKYILVIGLLKDLAAWEQEILSLRFIEGKSNEEIAEVLGISTRYVAVKISRSLKSLRRLAVKRGVLEELEEGGPVGK